MPLLLAGITPDQTAETLLPVVETDAKAFLKRFAQGVFFFLGDLAKCLLRKPYVKGIG